MTLNYDISYKCPARFTKVDSQLVLIFWVASYAAMSKMREIVSEA